MPRFVLASASTARLAALRAGGIDPAVIVSGVDESAIHADSVAELVLALASAKAAVVAAGLDDAIVLGCDSLLDLDGVGYGKPVDAVDARIRWQRMAGRSGVLRTGHALWQVRAGTVRNTVLRGSASTVHFGRPTVDELDAYLATDEPHAVAGAFTVDGLGGWFVNGIDGDPGTVVGVSRPLLRDMLGELGLSPVDFWHEQTADDHVSDGG